MEIIYKLTAVVDDEVVFESEYPDTTELQSELGKAEDIVGLKLQEENICGLCHEMMTANCNNGGCDE